MINRTRMLLDDLDSEGFPIPYPREFATLAAVNIGRIADHAMVQAILADHKCLTCKPVMPNAVDPFEGEPDYYTTMPVKGVLMTPEQADELLNGGTPPWYVPAKDGNPKGWDEVDGVPLPPITWGVPYDDIGGYPTEAEVQQARHLLELAEQRKLVDDADAKMDRPKHTVVLDLDKIPLEAQRYLTLMGLDLLSDSAAPEMFVGRKS